MAHRELRAGLQEWALDAEEGGQPDGLATPLTFMSYVIH